MRKVEVYLIPILVAVMIIANAECTISSVQISSSGTIQVTSTYTLSVIISPSGSGTVSLSPSGGTYSSGTSVSLTASANSVYTFSSWSGSGTGSYTGTANPCSVTMNSAITETATFSFSGSKSVYPANNVLVNGQFTNGFNGWDDENGWNGANGWASLDYTNYNLGAPSLRILPDPHGIYSGGDESSAWASGVSVRQNQEITYGCWVKTDSNPAGQGVGRGGVLGADFKDSHGTILNGVFDSYSGCTLTGDCASVAWGSGGWVHMEISKHCTSASVVEVVVWVMVFPQRQNGATAGSNFDDVYLIVG